jgi:hypothetical protein
MGLAVLDRSMSLDGFVSGPNDDDPNNPGGEASRCTTGVSLPRADSRSQGWPVN